MSVRVSLDNLPVELIASILSDLDIPALRNASETCAYLRAIASDSLLNPWRRPILRALMQQSLTPLKTLSVLSTVPRHNWLEILCYASPDFLLFEATLPNLIDSQYEIAFRRRFLPSWSKVRKAASWKSAFMKTLFSVHHRSSTNCTTSEAWTNFIIVNRTGVANSTTSLSRAFDPLALFNTLKENANLTHLPTSVRLILRLADVRIIMFGILHRKSSLFKNPVAEELMYPPGVHPPDPFLQQRLNSFGFSSSESITSNEDLPAAEESSSSPHSPQSPAASPHTSPLLSFTRHLTVRRARSVSSPVRSSAPSSPPASPRLSFWRTRSRDSGPPPVASSPHNSPVAGPSSGLALPNFMTRLFSSPRAISPDLNDQVPSSSHADGEVSDANDNEAEESQNRSHRHSRKRRREHRRQRQQMLAEAEEQSPLPTMQFPTPHPSHQSYPNYTPPNEDLAASGTRLPMNGSSDWRWFRTKYDGGIYVDSDALQLTSVEDDERAWIGPILIVAQLYPTYGPSLDGPTAALEPLEPEAFERSFLQGQSQPPGRWASFNWADLWAIAPWLQDRITKQVEGMGLGIE